MIKSKNVIDALVVGGSTAWVFSTFFLIFSIPISWLATAISASAFIASFGALVFGLVFHSRIPQGCGHGEDHS